MRVLMTVAIILCLSLYAVAGCENSTLVVHSKSGAPIKVYVDGMTGRNPATRGVTVNGLTPGEHLLKVVANYMDDYGRIRRHTIYTGYINVRPSKYMDAWVEEYKGVSIHETSQPCGDYAQGSPPPAGTNDEKPTDNTNAQPLNESQMYNNSGAQAPPSGNAPDHSSKPANSGNLPPHISDDDFEQLKSAINATQYEMKKLDTLKLLTAGDLFATSQVGELMGIFAFESNKLEVAKFLYDKTVDKQNYSRLASNFNFDARKEDFKKFMEGK